MPPKKVLQKTGTFDRKHWLFECRWQNFRSLHDSGWIKFRPLTVVIGSNNSGKTSLLAPLLLLKQTIGSSDRTLALNSRGPLFNAGHFSDLVSGHNTASPLTLGLRFHHHQPPANLRSPPAYPPGELEVQFGAGPNNEPALQAYIARDIYGRDLVRRVKSDGHFSLEGLEVSPRGNGSDTQVRRLEEAVLSSPPTRFLFVSEPFLRTYFESKMPKHKAEGKEPYAERLNLPVTDAITTYMSTVSIVASEIETLLRRISFVGPLRRHPQRVYELSSEQPQDVGVQGELAPEILFRASKGHTANWVGQWLDRIEPGLTLKCTPLGTEAFELFLVPPTGSPYNIADSGFGLSQILPLIVQCAISKEGGFTIAEQPEIHLNPRVQSILADLFVETVKEGRGVIVETHSEHLLLRLRRLVAQGKLRADEISLLYVEKKGTNSAVREIPMDDRGHIRPTEWPAGFFEDTLAESLALASTQAKRPNA